MGKECKNIFLSGTRFKTKIAKQLQKVSKTSKNSKKTAQNNSFIPDLGEVNIDLEEAEGGDEAEPKLAS